MAWTYERVEMLTILWKNGNSASQIAKELGEGVSRNAVIGKAHRLNLSAKIKARPTFQQNNEYLKSSASLKVVIDVNNNVIYYSRNIIPSNKNQKINPNIEYNTFTGIYVYNRSKIIEYGNQNNSFLQNEEDCEQLKLIENGYKIKSYKHRVRNSLL